MQTFQHMNPALWDNPRVIQWMIENQFHQWIDHFMEHQITGDVLMELNYNTLKDIGVKTVGDRARILQQIKKIQYQTKPVEEKPKPVQQDLQKSRSVPQLQPIEQRQPSKNLNFAISQLQALGLVDLPHTQPKMEKKEEQDYYGLFSSQKSDSQYDKRQRSGTAPNAQQVQALPLRMARTQVDSARSRGPLIYPRTSSIPLKEGKHSADPDAVGEIPSPNSPMTKKDESEKDIFNMENVRSTCIRVYGIDTQFHVFKVQGINDPNKIRKTVMKKFNYSKDIPHDLFIINPEDKDSLTLVNDEMLLQICQDPNNEHRGTIYLRKNIIPGDDDMPLDINTSGLQKEGGRSMQKLNKFFGEDLGSPVKSASPTRQPKTIQGPLRTTSLDTPKGQKRSGRSNKLLDFFGERPPDELIVDQLETFFPGLGNKAPSSQMTTAAEVKSYIKNIVQANLVNKRSSRRSFYPIQRRTVLLESNSARPPSIYSVQDDDLTTFKSDSVQSATLSETSKRSSKAPIVKWEQGRLIGQGGFGKVFHALNLDTGEMMAVKQVPIGSAANTRGMEALQHEIELLKDLEHENIVQYLGCEITETTINVFLEYVSGGSISSVLSKCGKFDTIYCQSFATQILCGLDYLHQKNIIHRDIKGANILVDQHGVAKITDFGISKKNDYMAYQRMTRMSMQGSINWMAPEVARGGKGYSAKVDIWSLGCLVLEMVSGHYPWHKVRGNIIYLLGTGNAPPLPSNINQMTQDFLNKCFTIDPEKRPTALDMLKHNFCDVNIETLNFTNWARDAQERRIQNGDSSEEESEDDDEEEESQDFETRLNKSSDDEWVVEQSPAVGYPDISYLLDHPELLQEDSD